MAPDNRPDRPESDGKETSIPLKWIFLTILAFVVLYHLTLYFKFR